MESKIVQSEAGEFETILYRSQNSALQKRWVISVKDPEGKLFQEFLRTRSGAERRARRWIARQEATLLQKNKAERALQEARREMERAGLSSWALTRLSRMPELRCQSIRPGEIMCSYLVRAISRDEWKATVFINGEEVCSKTAGSRKKAEREARQELQRAYEHDALRALGPGHAPD